MACCQGFLWFFRRSNRAVRDAPGGVITPTPRSSSVHSRVSSIDSDMSGSNSARWRPEIAVDTATTRRQLVDPIKVAVELLAAKKTALNISSDPFLQCTGTTPRDETKNTYPYYCPLCMQYYAAICEATCCQHSICVPCAYDYLSRRAPTFLLEEATRLEREKDVQATPRPTQPDEACSPPINSPQQRKTPTSAESQTPQDLERVPSAPPSSRTPRAVWQHSAKPSLPVPLDVSLPAECPLCSCTSGFTMTVPDHTTGKPRSYNDSPATTKALLRAAGFGTPAPKKLEHLRQSAVSSDSDAAQTHRMGMFSMMYVQEDEEHMPVSVEPTIPESAIKEDLSVRQPGAVDAANDSVLADNTAAADADTAHMDAAVFGIVSEGTESESPIQHPKNEV